MASRFRAQIEGVVANAPRRSDFAVVLQPVLSQGKVPDVTYLSDLDCFHPSKYGQRSLAIGVWNCMLLPKAQKPISWSPVMLFPLCPDDSTVFPIN